MFGDMILALTCWNLTVNVSICCLCPIIYKLFGLPSTFYSQSNFQLFGGCEEEEMKFTTYISCSKGQLRFGLILG